jgi:UDP-3-O-[3-hydroxymyristoyl] glucosamine N-acyltransferase
MKEVQIQQILNSIEYIDFIGNADALINEVISINQETSNGNVICWCNDKNLDKLSDISYGTVILSPTFLESNVAHNKSCNFIVVANPRNTFRVVLEKFFVEETIPEISKSARVHETATIGKGVFLGEGVVIEKDCAIGDNTVILHNTVVFSNSKIGSNVKIGANNTIGGTGFGYEKDSDGNFQLIPHLGNVILEDYVEIGNNTCIDRAVLGSTVLSENVKVDNLVHIAHGVKIGRNSVIIANAMIAGSVCIGENTWVSPSVSVMNQKNVGSDSLIGMGAVVLKDVGDYEVVVGNPGKLIKNLEKK